jgi:hypothetical protein
MCIESSKYTAVLTTPSSTLSFNTPKLPATLAKTMPLTLDLAYDPHNPPEQLRRSTCTLKSLYIMCNPWQGEGAVHPSTIAPCFPVPSLKTSGISTEGPDEAGVMMVENSALAQLEDFVSTELVFAADITDAQAFKPCMPTAAWCGPD